MTNTVTSGRSKQTATPASTMRVPVIQTISRPFSYLSLLSSNEFSKEIPCLILPSSINPKDKSQHLSLSANNTQISYCGPGKTDMDAASGRGNCAIPFAAGLFYYEVEIISKGRDGYIGVGFCGPNVSLGRLPGWDDYSWGYHGDDGNAFSCTGIGKPYGPSFTTGDVIGCVINLGNFSAGFTKNGIFLGTAFKDLRIDLKDRKGLLTQIYPMIGLRTPGEIVSINFGQKRFRFDIDGYRRVCFFYFDIYTPSQPYNIGRARKIYEANH